MFFLEEKNCAKCGRPAQAGQAFCPACLADMEKYPVKPGVVVLLPHREAQHPKASVRRKAPGLPAEELVKKLKKRVTVLAASLLVALAAIGGLLWYVVTDCFQQETPKLLPGQNYSAENTSSPNEAD